MSEEPAKETQPPPDPQKPIEQRAEEWGRNLDKKVEGLEKNMPKPVAALMDVVCFGLVILAACWLMARFGWIQMPSRTVFLILAGAIYLVSLAIRILRKPPAK